MSEEQETTNRFCKWVKSIVEKYSNVYNVYNSFEMIEGLIPCENCDAQVLIEDYELHTVRMNWNN